MFYPLWMKGVSWVQSIPIIICSLYRTIRVIWQQLFSLAEEKADCRGGGGGLRSVFERLRSQAMQDKKLFVLWINKRFLIHPLISEHQHILIFWMFEIPFPTALYKKKLPQVINLLSPSYILQSWIFTVQANFDVDFDLIKIINYVIPVIHCIETYLLFTII